MTVSCAGVHGAWMLIHECAGGQPVRRACCSALHSSRQHTGLQRQLLAVKISVEGTAFQLSTDLVKALHDTASDAPSHGLSMASKREREINIAAPESKLFLSCTGHSRQPVPCSYCNLQQSSGCSEGSAAAIPHSRPHGSCPPVLVCQPGCPHPAGMPRDLTCAAGCLP